MHSKLIKIATTLNSSQHYFVKTVLSLWKVIQRLNRCAVIISFEHLFDIITVLQRESIQQIYVFNFSQKLINDVPCHMLILHFHYACAFSCAEPSSGEYDALARQFSSNFLAHYSSVGVAAFIFLGVLSGILSEQKSVLST